MIDTDRGYINGCDHHSPDVPPDKLTKRERILVGTIHAEWERDQLEANVQETD